MAKLHNLVSAGKTRKRVGRGGSRGGTSGRGMGGQKSRTGGNSDLGLLFEGGQMPLTRRLPKRGFKNSFGARRPEIVTLRQLEHFFDAGAVVSLDLLREKKLLSSAHTSTVKVLGSGVLTKKLKIQAHEISAGARTSIEKVGGTVELIQVSRDTTHKKEKNA